MEQWIPLVKQREGGGLAIKSCLCRLPACRRRRFNRAISSASAGFRNPLLQVKFEPALLEQRGAYHATAEYDRRGDPPVDSAEDVLAVRGQDETLDVARGRHE